VCDGLLRRDAEFSRKALSRRRHGDDGPWRIAGQAPRWRAAFHRIPQQIVQVGHLGDEGFGLKLILRRALNSSFCSKGTDRSDQAAPSLAVTKAEQRRSSRRDRHPGWVSGAGLDSALCARLGFDLEAVCGPAAAAKTPAQSEAIRMAVRRAFGLKAMTMSR